MPGEPGELEAMSYAFRGCTGLQHEVIAMASCCKASQVSNRNELFGYLKGNNSRVKCQLSTINKSYVVKLVII